jgi:hypothetical protein
MNISILRLKGVIRELQGIRSELGRLADCWEVELGQAGINMRPPKADTTGPEPTVAYVDEEMEWAHETIEHLKRQDELKSREEE